MPIVRGIFVSPDRITHQMISGVIKITTQSNFTHVAVGFGQRMIEAILPKVCWSPISKYKNEPVFKILYIPVTTEQYRAGLAMAESLVGVPYGFDDVLIGGISDLMGAKVGKGFADHIDATHTLDCSSLYTTVMRTMFPTFLEGYKPSMITPGKAYQATKKILKLPNKKLL